MIELGANDALRGIPPEQTEKNLEQIITRLKERNIPILLVGMLAPPNLGREYGEEFAAVFRRQPARRSMNSPRSDTRQNR